MGFISERAKGRALPPLSVAESRATWREIFPRSDKEPSGPYTPPPNPVNPYSRVGSLADRTAQTQFLRALRAGAPPGWTDDRLEQSRHYVGIAYVAIHRCNEQMAQAEFQVYVKDDRHPDGKLPVPKSHPGHRLVRLLEKPNPDDGFGDLMANWNLQMDLTGSALTWMVPSLLESATGAGDAPCELYPVPTATAQGVGVYSPEYPNGYYRIQPYYLTGPFSYAPNPNVTAGTIIPTEQVLKFKYPHPLVRQEGYSPQTALRLHLDQVEMIDRSRFCSMKESINPSAVLSFDEAEGSQPLPEEEIERIRSDMEATHQSPENHGRLYVTPPGSKLNPWGQRPVDMDYPRGWDQLVSFTLGGFGITRQAAGMIEDASYSTLFATLKQLYWLTLEPKCSRFAATLTRHLAPHFGNDLIVEIRTKRIDDHDVKRANLQLLVNAKAMTKNELRHELSLGLTDEGWGEEIAGTYQPSPEQMAAQQAAQNGQAGGREAEAVGAAAGMDPREQALLEEAMRILPSEISRSRPDPGRMGQGSMGPRKDKRPTANGRH